MDTSMHAARAWRLGTAALLGCSALLAFRSGDLLLILAVCSAAGGLTLLGRPWRARPAATAPRPVVQPARSASLTRAGAQWSGLVSAGSQQPRGARPRALSAGEAARRASPRPLLDAS
jgi:hypothetical protein